MKIITGLAMIVFLLIMPAFSQTTSSPQEQFAQYMLDLKNSPDDQGIRENIIKLVLGMKHKPAVPEDFQRYIVRGKEMAKTAASPDEFKEAIQEFKNATLIAPWEGKAYYYLGVVQNKSQDFDGAMQSFNLYVLASPHASNVRKVKDLIYKLEVDKERAGQAKKEIIKTIADNFAAKVEKGYFTNKGMEELYAYDDPEDSGHYYNVSRMSNGRVICILLRAQSQGGNYAGDVLDILDETDISNDKIYPSDLSLQEQEDVDVSFNVSGVQDVFKYSVVEKEGQKFIKLTDTNNISAVLPLNGLFRARAQKSVGTGWEFEIGSKNFKVEKQGGMEAAHLFFGESAIAAANNPDSNWQDMLPTYVLLTNKMENGQNVYLRGSFPIGNSGYFYKNDGKGWNVEDHQ